MKMSYKTFLAYRRLLYKHRHEDATEYNLRHHVLYNMWCLYDDSLFMDIKAFEKEYIRRYNTKRRWKKYLQGMIQPYEYLYLVSLTFTDDVLNSTSAETRKKYIQRFLNDNTVDFFACADFGEEMGREHYHAICRISNKQFVPYLRGKTIFYEVYPFDYPYGFISIREISLNPQDAEKSLFYAFKSSLYAFKSSDNKVKPFHKRGVLHSYVPTDEELFLLFGE